MEELRFISFEERNFSGKSRETIDQANEIISEYHADGYTLTLRQLYYQFVSRNLIENTERSYKNLGSVMNDARMAGLVAWNGIEDRGREHDAPYLNEDMQEVFNGLESFYKVDLWKRQPYYVEAWIEKEALGNVLERPCKRYRVPFMSCKGYLSVSAMWRAGERFQAAAADGRECVLIHLGDHDPSGIDMTRDNGERLGILSRFVDLDVRRIALNMDQIRQYNPPPNPAKVTDSRSTGYIKKFGNKSWELDALEPSVIAALVEKEIETLIDKRKWNAAIKEEQQKHEYLRRFYDEFHEIDNFMGGDNSEED